MTTVTINGNTYTDDTNPSTGMGNGGHRDRFIPALYDVVVVAGEVAADATAADADATAAALSETNAAASAAAAAAVVSSYLSIAAFSGTTTTSLTIGTGTQTFTTQTGKSFYPGMSIKLFNAVGIWMAGTCTAYTTGTGSMTVEAERYVGSGTYASWTVGVMVYDPSDDAFFWATYLN